MEGYVSIAVRRTRLLTFAVAVLAALLIAESAVLGATLLKSGGAVKAVKIVANDLLFHTTSTSLVNMTGMSTTMTVPSGQKALFLITVSTSCSVSGAGSAIVRVLVDRTSALPSDQGFCSGDSGSGSNSYQYFAGPLNAGNHTVALQFRVNNAAGEAFLVHPVMTVMRVKVG